MSQEDDDFALALTKGSYEKLREDHEPVQLTIEEKELLTDEVKAANEAATREAIITLIRSHLAEFEQYLKTERQARGIAGKVQTGWKNYLDKSRDKDTKL